MSSNDYTASSGALKIKGLGGVKKKKKPRSKKKAVSSPGAKALHKVLEKKKAAVEVDKEGSEDNEDREELASPLPQIPPPVKKPFKTEAEIAFEEKRRKRLLEQRKNEKPLSHQDRVENLNNYLSSLSEHHDMPRIGPG